MGIPGHMSDVNRPLDPDATKRVRIPDAFLHDLIPLLSEGSSLMITDEPVLESTTGVNLAVLSSSPEAANTDPKKQVALARAWLVDAYLRSEASAGPWSPHWDRAAVPGPCE